MAVLGLLGRPFRGGNGAHFGAHFEIAGLEVIQRFRSFEHDELRERLASRLGADARLCHLRLANELASLFINQAVTMRAAHDKSSFTYVGEDGESGGFADEVSKRWVLGVKGIKGC